MTFSDFVSELNNFAWGPWMLLLLVGTGVYLSIRVGFIQFGKFGYAMKNTLGKLFQKQSAGEGEMTPFQAVATALAATVGTGNIAGVTGAIAVGGPGEVFWMWVSALFGMVTKYAEVVLAVKYRERNANGEWAGGPMYYIRNGLGKSWNWLASIFCILAVLASFGIGNMTQVNSIASAINNALDTFGANAAGSFVLFGQDVRISSIVIGALVAVVVGLVLFGGMKRLGTVTELMVPFMAAVYIIAAVVVVITHAEYIGEAFALIFKGAFTPDAALGGATGIVIMTTIQKGVGRGVFSNEAGLGSAPIAHASTSETDPVKQGLYGIFEVFMDTIVICTLTSMVVLLGICSGGADVTWGASAGVDLITACFSTVFGGTFSSMIMAVGLGLFALSTIISWSFYGTRCCEFLLGPKVTRVYQCLFVVILLVGSSLELELVWNIADTLNGFMAIPNLIALLGLSGVVIKLTKEHFSALKK